MSRDFEAAAVRAKALGDPTRMAIVAYLLSVHPTPISVAKIADEIDRHQSRVSRHCGVLVEAGLATRRKMYRYTHYQLTDQALRLIEAVLDDNLPDGSNQRRPADADR